MRTSEKNKHARRAGFSMIEVLVASTILVVIVMMLAMLFQQTSLAWRTGVKRASGYMQLRSVLGAIQRDASAAVDEGAISVKNASGGYRFGNGQNFSGSLQFYTLTGSGYEDPNTKKKPYRALKYITYNTAGKRTELLMKGDGTGDPRPSSEVLNFVKPSNNNNSPTITISGFEPKYAGAAIGLPLYFTVKAQVTTKGYALDIGAASAGPDGEFGTSAGDPKVKDDI